ncbi:MAG TPA: DUF1616 domain-containing protein [Methanomassiliicoccales archaeon]|nr:DUF1616 domain-containing protein [Methanomassiliicoccales archaeon]HQQ24978.1 DUF1616 domain-containing protein [Methanomassiliicoccales archaeon]
MKAQPRRDWDLWSIGILSLILILVIYALPDSVLRIVIGLPFILFFPGYSALSVLFPESKDLEIIERVALSFGLSIAISPLVGFGLNYTPFGIRLAPILFSLAALNIALSVGGLYRREKAESPYLPFDPAAVWKKYSTQFKAEKGVDKVLTVVLVISILSSVIALVYVVAVPRQGESFTEFYILGPGGNATGYPRNLTVGQDASVIIGIANHEHREVRYTVELWLVNMSFVDNATQVHAMYFFDSFNVTLEHTDVDLEGEWQPQWELPYDFNVSIEGNYKLWFLLYKDGAPALPFAPSPMMDYTGTSAEDRIIRAVENEVQSLNLNLRVTV